MDPISCFALAGTVVQFVDFTGKLIVAGHELYKAGELSVHEKAALATNDLLDLSTKLQRPLRSDPNLPLTEDETTLRDICVSCHELSSVPECLAKEGFERVGRSKFRSAIDTRILISLRQSLEAMSIQESQQFDAMDRQTQQIITALSDLHKQSAAHEKEQLFALSELLSHGDVVVLSRQEEQTRNEAMGEYQISESAKSLRERLSLFRDPEEEEEQLRRSVSKEILTSLLFEDMNDRYEGVSEAHKETFEWIYKDSPFERTTWSKFSDWLQHKDGLYWIQGKAGSGKSTLMKYICENPLTMEYLEVWANEQPLYTTESFLWNIGTKLQKSQIGLLRTLLYELLRKAPDLIPVVLPKRWAASYSSRCRLVDDLKEISWSMSELMTAFEVVLSQEIIPMKVCMFIDGLDEYDGLDSDMVKLFTKAAPSRNVKVCASSRPEVVYHDAFSKWPGLRLQDLTESDIRQYVTDRLEEDLSIKQPHEFSELVNEIVRMASGVFLWVELVVTSLLMGLGNNDQISTLWKRLELLPKGLEELYKRIVLNVDEIYLEETSRIFQIVDAWNRGTEKVELLYSLSILTLALALDRHPTFQTTETLWTVEQMDQFCRDTEDQLKSRCGGLLEILPGKENDHLSSVEYHHRTVRDFLMKTESREFLAHQTAGASFNPHFLLHNACTRQLYCISRETLKSGGYTNWYLACLFDSALAFARRLDTDGFSAYPLVDQILLKAREYSALVKDGELLSEDDTLKLAIIFGFSKYVQLFISKNPEGAREGELLHVALAPPTPPPYLDMSLIVKARISHESKREILMSDELFSEIDSWTIPEYPSPPIIQTLLNFGANPNEKVRESTPWIKMLEYVYENGEHTSLSKNWLDTIKIMLSFGADPSATFYPEGGDEPWTIRTLIEDVIDKWDIMAGDRDEILALLPPPRRHSI